MLFVLALLCAAAPEPEIAIATTVPAALAAESVVKNSAYRSKLRRARMTPNERTKERAKYAQKRRVDLVKLLSPEGKCSGCGETFEHPSLTIQHAGESGASFVHNRSSQHGRAAAYWREYKAGVPLEAMCGSCNSSDGQRHYGKYRRAA
jgi:hypothetical protein